jgi:ABC-type transporter Mla subunit MlaD
MVDHTERTLTELGEGINQTDSAIQRCQEILRGLGQPRTEGLQAVVQAIQNLLPKLEQDLTDLRKAYDAMAKASPKRIS